MALGLTPYQIIEKNKYPLLRIPDDWNRVDLMNIAKVQNGYAFKSKFFNKSSGLPLIRIRDIARTETENFYSGEYSEDFIVKNKDILIGMDGDFNVSKWPGEKGLLNQRVCRLKPFSKFFDHNFLFICLQPYLNAIHQETSAVTVKHLSSKTIQSIPLPLPPLPIQRAIVAKIEQLFSELDNGIQNLQQAKEKLTVFRQAVLKKAFEDCLNLKKLETISVSFGGFAFKSKDFKEQGEYQIIRIGNVRQGNIRLDASPVFIDEINEKIEEKYLLKRGDIVISLTGTRFKRDYGYTAIINNDNLLLNQRLAYIRFGEEYLSKFFLYFSWTNEFKNQFFDAETGNTGQGNVGMKAIKDTLVPVLPIQNQNQIVQEIESRLSVCDEMEKSIESSLKKAEALRQSILKKAFEGELLTKKEIDQCKQEPDWETAEELLARIEMENNKTKKSKKK